MSMFCSASCQPVTLDCTLNLRCSLSTWIPFAKERKRKERTWKYGSSGRQNYRVEKAINLRMIGGRGQMEVTEENIL